MQNLVHPQSRGVVFWSEDARSWAIIVDGLGAAEGTYARTGADKGASIFSQRPPTAPGWGGGGVGPLWLGHSVFELGAGWGGKESLQKE